MCQDSFLSPFCLHCVLARNMQGRVQQVTKTWHTQGQYYNPEDEARWSESQGTRSRELQVKQALQDEWLRSPSLNYGYCTLLLTYEWALSTIPKSQSRGAKLRDFETELMSLSDRPNPSSFVNIANLTNCPPCVLLDVWQSALIFNLIGLRSSWEISKTHSVLGSGSDRSTLYVGSTSP